MSRAEAQPRRSAWSGAVLAGLFVLAPLLAWLWPLGFAPVAGLAGLLTLRTLSLAEEDRPAAIAVLVLITWALCSGAWSLFEPKTWEQATALKLIVQAPLYWSVACAARAAAARTRLAGLVALAWGMAGLGALLCAEALTGAGIYQAVREAIGDPIRPDLAVRNVAQASFVLAVLAPAASLAGLRTGAGPWLALPMAAGVVAAGLALEADAPAIAMALSLAAGALVYRWPVWAPRVLAGLAALFFLVAPFAVLASRRLGWFDALQANVPLSWSQRMGYWRHAADWIADHPFSGWGLDASRMMHPGIKLHPHNAALQLWLELGLIGAMCGAVIFGVVLASLSAPRRDTGRAVTAATAVAYLAFMAVSFGVWQEWWLAVGATAAAACFAVRNQAPRAKGRAGAAARPSTSAAR